MNEALDYPVLITGGAGYIGSHVVLTLLDNGCDVVVVDDLSTGWRGAVPQNVPFYEGKAGDGELIQKVINEHNCSSVMHFAGSIVVPESVALPLDYYYNNVIGSAGLLRACLDNGIKYFVFSSTAAVYNSDRAGELPITEDAELVPENPYGRSKLMTEWILQDVAAATDLRFAVLRYFNVCGADRDGRSGQYSATATHLIKRACQTVLGIQPYIDVFGTDYPTLDGTCVRDYIHVSDLAHAHLAILGHMGRFGENLTINCGYGRGYSVNQVLDVVDDVSRKTLGAEAMERRLGPRRPGDPPSLIANTRRITEILNWQPLYDDLSVMVATALAWEKQLMDQNKNGEDK